MEAVKEDVVKLSTEHDDLKRRVDRLEDAATRHDADIRQLYAAQEGTKAYVSQILSKIDALETKLFSYVTQVTQGSQTDQAAAREERTTQQKTWVEFAKYVIAATIGAVLLYIVKGGGK